MNRTLSTYLNVLRIMAALAVFVGHLCIWGVGCGSVATLPWLGHDGVVIFFVLSGYVIAYTTDVKDRTGRDFAISRCTRIYSVVIPTIILTIGLEAIGVTLYPGNYIVGPATYQFDKLWLYLPLWLSFASEFWHLNEPIFTNGAFWSLCFEVWYYVSYAILMFMSGWRRLLWLLAVIVLVGPKIVILAPLWWLGVAAFHAQKRLVMDHRKAVFLFVTTMTAYVTLRVFNADGWFNQELNAMAGGYPKSQMQMAWTLPGDLIIAFLVTVNIYAACFIKCGRIADGLKSGIDFVASFTFSVYLIHLPVLKFSVVSGWMVGDSILMPAVITLLTVIAFGSVTERRTRVWRAAFTAIIDWLLQYRPRPMSSG